MTRLKEDVRPIIIIVVVVVVVVVIIIIINIKVPDIKVVQISPHLGRICTQSIFFLRKFRSIGDGTSVRNKQEMAFKSDISDRTQ